MANCVSINVLNVAQIIIYYLIYLQLRKHVKLYQRQVINASINRDVIMRLRNKVRNYLYYWHTFIFESMNI